MTECDPKGCNFRILEQTTFPKEDGKDLISCFPLSIINWASTIDSSNVHARMIHSLFIGVLYRSSQSSFNLL